MPDFEKTDESEKLSSSTDDSTKTSSNVSVFLIKIYNFYKKYSNRLKSYLPFGILTISLIEIICHMFINKNLQNLLRFEPSKMHQPWRFITYMFLHEDWIHLSLNIFMQVLFALFLEVRHGQFRILVLYFLGGITAVLGASCFHPNLIIGASGGVYALLISHIADILMNYENMKYNIYRSLCILNIVLFDIIYNVIHFNFKKDPVISWETHVIGGTSGLFLGLMLFKKEDGKKTRSRLLFCTGFVFYGVLVFFLVFTTLQIRKCTPEKRIQTLYVYFC